MLHVTAAVSGAAIMLVELVGTRVIGPFYGASLYVWTALIAVTLLALASGYRLGGLLADRAPSFGLEHSLAAAGLLCALVPVASRPVLLATDALGLRAGALCSALLLFLLPLMALATVGPLAVQRSVRRDEAVGLTVGRVFAWSTAGSVVGTVLFGFFLLPAVGWPAILFGLGAVLVLVSALVALIERRRSLGSTLRTSALLAALVLSPWVAERGEPPGGHHIVFDAEGIHGRVRVIDDLHERVRWLLSDASTLGSVELDTGANLFPYLDILAQTPALRPQARRALLVGVGGGWLPAVLEARGLPVDCIEIDPAVAAAARECFGFRPGGRLVLGDARYVLRRLDRCYDLVLHDCFTGGGMPAHLFSREALLDVKRCMTPEALLALNFVGSPGSPVLACMRASLRAAFGRVEAIVVDPSSPLTDVIFLATDGPLDRDALAAVARGAGCGAPDAALAAPGPSGAVLTDAFNPLEFLQAGTSERYRDLLVERVAVGVLGR